MDFSTSEGSQRLSTTFLASSNLPTYKMELSDAKRSYTTKMGPYQLNLKGEYLGKPPWTLNSKLHPSNNKNPRYTCSIKHCSPPTDRSIKFSNT